MSGDQATVAFLLEHGATVNAMSAGGTLSISSGMYLVYSSPSHYAALVGSVAMLRVLGRKGADLTALDHFSRTPLSYAVQNLNEEAVDFLSELKHPYRGELFSAGPKDDYLGPGHECPVLGAFTMRSKRIRQCLYAIVVTLIWW